jgi:hypothetical protein
MAATIGKFIPEDLKTLIEPDARESFDLDPAKDRRSPKVGNWMVPEPCLGQRSIRDLVQPSAPLTTLPPTSPTPP